MAEELNGPSLANTPRLLRLEGLSEVIVYNSHAREYEGLATVRVDTPYIKVFNITSFFIMRGS